MFEDSFYMVPPWLLGFNFFVNTIIQLLLFIFFIWATLSIVKSLRRIADSLEYMKTYAPSTSAGTRIPTASNPSVRPDSSEQKVSEARQAAIDRMNSDDG